MYLKEIRDESLLTAAEECTLAEAIARGDKDARSRMIQANLRLVVKIARDYLGRGMILEDLIGEGNLGLIRATEEFQPRFGTRFSTYAGLLDQAVDPPRSDQYDLDDPFARPHGGLLTKWRRSERALCRELGRTPSFNEVASHLELERDPEIAWWPRRSRLASSSWKVASPSGPDWRSVLGSNDRYASPHALLEAGDEWDILWSRMERLDARERTILVLTVWPGRRIAVDAQGDRSPAGRDPGMGPQDRDPGGAKARRQP